MNTMGGRLKALRKERGQPVETLAGLLGVSRAAWYGWESDNPKPSRDHLATIAKITEWSLDWIILGRNQDG